MNTYQILDDFYREFRAPVSEFIKAVYKSGILIDHLSETIHKSTPFEWDVYSISLTDEFIHYSAFDNDGAHFGHSISTEEFLERLKERMKDEK